MQWQRPKPVQEPFERISVEKAKELKDAGVRVIDVREPHETALGHVPGADLIPLTRIVKDARTYVQPGEEIAFICAGGHRSAVACEAAVAAGIGKAYNIEGGTMEWMKKGLPIEK